MLYQRAEVYDAPVPDGVLMLTAGIDVQADRIEYEVVGWNKDEESWSDRLCRDLRGYNAATCLSESISRNSSAV